MGFAPVAQRKLVLTAPHDIYWHHRGNDCLLGQRITVSIILRGSARGGDVALVA